MGSAAGELPVFLTHNFSYTFIENEPKWDIFKHSKIQDFPSIKWKIHNQEKMRETKKDEYLGKVKKVLSYN